MKKVIFLLGMLLMTLTFTSCELDTVDESLYQELANPVDSIITPEVKSSTDDPDLDTPNDTGNQGNPIDDDKDDKG